MVCVWTKSLLHSSQRAGEESSHTACALPKLRSARPSCHRSPYGLRQLDTVSQGHQGQVRGLGECPQSLHQLVNHVVAVICSKNPSTRGFQLVQCALPCSAAQQISRGGCWQRFRGANRIVRLCPCSERERVDLLRSHLRHQWARKSGASVRVSPAAQGTNRKQIESHVIYGSLHHWSWRSGV